MSIGLHASADKITVSKTDSSGIILAIETFQFDAALTLEDWQQPELRLASRISECVDTGAEIILSVPRGVHHIRRVPLEVAEDLDQKSQVEWEVAQTLAAAPGDHRVDYEVRGSSAIWVAVSSAFLNRLCEALEPGGVSLCGICASPIAVTNLLRQHYPGSRSTCLVAESEWITRVDLEDQAISGIEAIQRVPTDVASQVALLLHAHNNLPENAYIAGEPEVVEQVLAQETTISTLEIPGDWPQTDPSSAIAVGASLHALTERAA